MKKLLALSALVLVLINCKKSGSGYNNQTCTYDSCATKAPASEIKNVQDYLTANNITATQHCSGLFYSIETPGSGTAPNACSIIKVKYVGKLTDGTVFDQTQNGNTYSTYLLNVIKGWTNGIPYIKPGGKIHLYIPPTLGYGSRSNGPIPANSILIFDVELLSVN